MMSLGSAVVSSATAPVIPALMLGLVLGLGCRGAPVDNVELVLSGDDSCMTLAFDEITDLSIDVIGFDAAVEGGFCILGKRCIPGVSLQSMADVEAVLQDQRQPLVDVESEQAIVIEITGHRQSCLRPDDRVLCGRGDLASVGTSGELSVLLQCDSCVNSAMNVPFCP